MNYEAVYETLEAKLTDLFPNASLHRPNNAGYQKSGLDIDISVSEIDVHVFTESEIKRDVSIDILVSTPAASGTERCNTIAAKISEAFSPIGSHSCLMFYCQSLDIMSVRQMPANIEDDRYAVNVRILAILYTDS